MNIIVILISLVFLQSDSKLKQLEFLIGTWQVNGKQTFESWTFENNKYQGIGYKNQGAEKIITEYLSIELKENQMIYTARVPNQNKGEGIPFILNSSEKDIYSFENKNHDFPNKIQYEIINDKQLKAHVLNNAGKGFTLDFKKIVEINK